MQLWNGFQFWSVIGTGLTVSCIMTSNDAQRSNFSFRSTKKMDSFVAAYDTRLQAIREACGLLVAPLQEVSGRNGVLTDDRSDDGWGSGQSINLFKHRTRHSRRSSSLSLCCSVLTAKVVQMEAYVVTEYVFMVIIVVVFEEGAVNWNSEVDGLLVLSCFWWGQHYLCEGLLPLQLKDYE